MSTPPVMLGMQMQDVDIWSDRVVVALGKNPSAFTGPGTNTYLVGTGKRRILIDPGQGVAAYLPVLERALELAGCEGIQEIVLTHGHPDHIGGVSQVRAHFGDLEVKKRPWPENDSAYPFEMTPIDHDSEIEGEGVHLRAMHTPGHAPDHLCFVLSQENALFSGDNVLGIGTTVIPASSGDLGDYMASLERMLAAEPGRIYPAHGPCIENGPAKLREYIAHRKDRDEQILAAIKAGACEIHAIVKIVYSAYPEALHAAAGQSVGSHLRKLEKEGRVTRSGAGDLFEVAWRLA